MHTFTNASTCMYLPMPVLHQLKIMYIHMSKAPIGSASGHQWYPWKK